jgi:ferredoxin/mono/diheme cytochrome c family protein
MTPRSGPRLVPALERATFRAERPVRAAVRSNRLNPLPHAGTISVFLLAVVIVTGVYVTLFYGFGFDASHRAVERMHDHPIQSVVRTVHRYASAALVLTTLVHAWRIFVAGRFRGPRRWRWTSGVAALVVVWLAGVTGYWLVWDERAQALNEAVANLFGGVGAVSDLLVRNVYGPNAGSGWGVLFVIWTVHLLLTCVIGLALWRHVRRSRLPIVPPRMWMTVMLGALVLAAIVFPAEILEQASPARTVGGLPLDPFVLFLLPPLLSSWAWAAVMVLTLAVVVALVAPHVASAPTPVVEIDPDACTGCELCVVDCPYLALDMAELSVADADDGIQARRPIAVVDAQACVGCGICIGSCSFDAMHLPGYDHAVGDGIDPTGRHVVIACARHASAAGGADALAALADDVVVVEVACSGMLHANAIGALDRAGATEVQVVGCAPGDCAYGLGNTILDERLAGTRAPHVPRRWSGVADEDFVAPGELVAAIEAPNQHGDLSTSAITARRMVGAGLVVVTSIAAVVLATWAPYQGSGDESAVWVIVDHTPGYQLEGQPDTSGRLGDDVAIVVRSDGEAVGERTLGRGGATAIGIVDVGLPDPTAPIAVEMVEGATVTELYRGTPSLEPGERLVVTAVDVPPPPGAAEGRKVFDDQSPGSCDVCHSVDPGDDRVGPSLAGIADTAATRIPGLSAEEYLRQSILDPDAYIVDGYRAGQMLQIYDERLSDEQLDALLVYLMSLQGGGQGGAP